MSTLSRGKNKGLVGQRPDPAVVAMASGCGGGLGRLRRYVRVLCFGGGVEARLGEVGSEWEGVEDKEGEGRRPRRCEGRLDGFAVAVVVRTLGRGA